MIKGNEMNRTSHFFIIAALAAVVVFFLLLPEPRAPQPSDWPTQPGNDFMLRDVRVFDGERFHERRDVLVRDGMIAAVGHRLSRPDGTPEFAAAGHTLLPALIDAHTHNFMDSRREALRFGVGTQIDLFTAHQTLAAARAERESLERTDSADMWSAGMLVTAAGGHGTQIGLPVTTLDSAADADAFVAARIQEGSDFIKLVLESGHSWGGSMPTLDAETLAAVIAATHARGKLAVVHIGSHDEARVAVEAGADGLVHLFGDEVIGAELVDAMRERGVFVIPTLTVMESIAGRAHGLLDDPEIAPYLSPAQQDSLRNQFPGARAHILSNALASTRMLHEAGVTLLAGSDAPNPGTAHGASQHRELELLVEAGMTPTQALTAATRAPAAAFGLVDRGRIAAGMRADLLLVADDPLTDITTTRGIVAVWKNGYRVERARFDGAAAAGTETLDDPVLGTFDDGADGWFETTDSIQGGQSEVTLTTADGVLAMDATVRSGASWPWAGAMRMLAERPVDISGHSELVLELRGTGTVHVLFFSGAGAQGMPAFVPITLTGEWQDVRIVLAEVPGLDRERTAALAVVAGPQPGAVRIELRSAMLR